MRISLEPKFAPRIRISRQRLLPQPGEILVHQGERVQAMDIVARAVVAGGTRIVDVARALRVPRERVEPYIVVSPGQLVESGEPLAVRSLLGERWQRTCPSPITGRVLSFGGGYIFLQTAPRVLNRYAYLCGEVTEIHSLYGVTVTGEVAWVQGIWGRGGTAWAPINVVVSDPSDPLSWERIAWNCKGTIIVGGSLLSRKSLLRAYRFGVAGLITGSIDPDLFHDESGPWPIPVVITEGVGSIPMASPVFELLLQCHGKHATISGGEGGGWGMPRPEIFSPLEEEAKTEAHSAEMQSLRSGDIVRLTRPPELGQIGRVINPNLPDTRFESGLQGPGVELRMSNHHRIRVPLTNVELFRT